MNGTATGSYWLQHELQPALQGELRISQEAVRNLDDRVRSAARERAELDARLARVPSSRRS